ncbi:hypothetical protein BWQ96_05436 [Gracilariopsis chorda]|uniref:Uncharacterized protein n=1 Tax=Gracilariopsis chorda TaxID=448386 RepID=A0A2V3IRL5_9FLOR|nr:hypothetical protein BWQ96_05436 [Gracilariopsis chorda]|eukprot:PXF44766.1 hypothetical protein BWQ96_05436 [Gracilariopsis chorda]
MFENASLPQKGHTQHITSPNFDYIATVFPSYRVPRCVLVRCGPPNQPQTTITTTCDTLQVSVQRAKRNITAHHCVSDFLLSHWDTMESSYKHGVSYVSNKVILGTDARNLPFLKNSISVSMDEKRRTISTQWLSFLPSNATRALLRAWLDNAKNHPADENMALSRIRGCAGKDISCHSRQGVIGATCEKALRCGKQNSFLLVVARTIVLLAFLQACALVVSEAAIPAEVIAVLLLVVSLFAMKWTSAACTIARSVLCRCRSSLSAASHMDGTLYEGELRGWYEGRAYLLRDGVHEVRVTGGMQPFFPGLFSLFMFFKRVIGDWVLFCGSMVVILVGFSARLVRIVASWKKGGEEEKDDYVRSIDDIRALGVQKRGYGRRFLGRGGRRGGGGSVP